MPSISDSDSAEAADIIRTAQRYAADIVSGTVSPYDGARRIWKACQLRLPKGDHRLDPFVYWASEYEDTSDDERRALCDKGLRNAATLLIENGTAI
jgi:hypothetical protein